MATGKVSSAFKNAVSRMPGVEEAKQAEANLSNIPMPDGWKGKVLLTDMFMDVSKGKGNPYCNIEVTVVEDKEFQGQKATRNFTFNETTNNNGVKTTPAQRFEWFLNALEYMGLPHELRAGYEDESELIAFFMDPENPTYLDCEVKTNQGYKNLNLRKLPEAVDHSERMAPAETTKKPTQEKTATEGERVVTYGETKWTVLEELPDDTLRIKSKGTGKERIVKKTDIEQ